MRLIVKFNIVFLAIFLVGLAIAAYVSLDLLRQNARDEVLQHARIMMESALATRGYTSKQVRPLLETQMKYQFLPQSVPAFAAQEQFSDLRKKFTDYDYKEATLNPTNPRNRATDWETDVVNQFRQAPDRAEIIGERDTPTGRALYMARPLQIKDAACLYCHSTKDQEQSIRAGEWIRLEGERGGRRTDRQLPAESTRRPVEFDHGLRSR